MVYIPILLVCLLQTGYVGDKDTGATCLKFRDQTEVHYETYEACAVRLRELVESVQHNQQWLAIMLPGPKRYKGDCYVPTIDEKVA